MVRSRYLYVIDYCQFSRWKQACLSLGYLTIAGALLCLSSLLSAPAHGHHLVKRHQLDCGTTFPCSESLRRRVDFWVHVFRQWNSNQVALHDPAVPERVYQVLDTTGTCRKKNAAPAIEKARARIKRNLLALADKVSRGQTSLSDNDQHLLGLFPKRRAADIRKAARQIRCQQGNRDRFKEALRRFGRYEPMVVRALADAKLPADLKYLPFVESAYNPDAYSRVGAAGMWQIMPSTARVLGLQLSATIDERLDPHSATRGATVYFRNSTRRLMAEARAIQPGVTNGEVMPFIVTSYNYGIAGMSRAVRKMGPDFIKVLNGYKSPNFRTAVRNFYASFLAARHVAQKVDVYFGEIKPLPPLRYNTVELRHATSLKRIKKVFGVTEKDLKPLNRALTRYVWHGWRFIPRGYVLRLPARKGAWSEQIAQLRALPVEDTSRDGFRYTVKRGDTACGVAQAFQVNCKALIGINRLGRRGMIRVGQKIIIPGRSGGSTQVATASQSATGKSTRVVTRYRVRRGDTPCGVARRFSMSCKKLMALNGIGSRGIIQIGDNLKVHTTRVAKKSAKKPAKTQIVVRRGDTVCGIAKRHNMACKRLMAMNDLNSRGLIRVGQKLKLTDKVSGAKQQQKTASNQVQADKPAEIVVRRGDTVCSIAKRAGVECERVLNTNGLKPRSLIRPGQRLKLPQTAGVRTALAQAKSVPSPAVKSPAQPSYQSTSQTALSQTIARKDGSTTVSTSHNTAPLDSDIDLSVSKRSVNGKAQFYIYVEPEETLGHFADWLGIGYATSLRRLNSIGRNKGIVSGQRIALPVKSDEQITTFLTMRQEYHRVLVEEFKEHYSITRLDDYVVQPGDSAWKIANEHELPLWVVSRYNPSLRKKSPKVGTKLTLPRIVPVDSQTEPPVVDNSQSG